MKGQIISVVRDGAGNATFTVRCSAPRPAEPDMPQGDDDKSREARRSAAEHHARATAEAVGLFEAAVQEAYDAVKAGRAIVELVPGGGSTRSRRQASEEAEPKK